MTYQIRKRAALYQVFFANGIVPIYSAVSRARCQNFIDEQKLAESFREVNY